MSKAEFISYKVHQLKDLAEKLDFLKNETGSGFIRMSDSERECVLENTVFPELAFKTVPFLFEAAFYVEGKYSVMIRQFNDFWQINQVNWRTRTGKKCCFIHSICRLIPVGSRP